MIGAWRVGEKIQINIYDDDRPVCQCHTVEDARLIVLSVNERKLYEECSKEDSDWREKFNAAIIGFDATYAGKHYLESAVDVIARARRAEDAYQIAIAALGYRAEQGDTYARQEFKRANEALQRKR